MLRRGSPNMADRSGPARRRGFDEAPRGAPATIRSQARQGEAQRARPSPAME
jgi:hypothetical protein